MKLIFGILSAVVLLTGCMLGLGPAHFPQEVHVAPNAFQATVSQYVLRGYRVIRNDVFDREEIPGYISLGYTEGDIEVEAVSLIGRKLVDVPVATGSIEGSGSVGTGDNLVPYSSRSTIYQNVAYQAPVYRHWVAILKQ